MDQKRKLMELIDNMPPHEGKSFEEALAEHLLANGVRVGGREKHLFQMGMKKSDLVLDRDFFKGIVSASRFDEISFISAVAHRKPVVLALIKDIPPEMYQRMGWKPTSMSGYDRGHIILHYERLSACLEFDVFTEDDYEIDQRIDLTGVETLALLDVLDEMCHEEKGVSYIDLISTIRARAPEILAEEKAALENLGPVADMSGMFSHCTMLNAEDLQKAFSQDKN